eukprot:14722424-Alexandrium_andersonii.AAC.1
MTSPRAASCSAAPARPWAASCGAVPTSPVRSREYVRRQCGQAGATAADAADPADLARCFELVPPRCREVQQ